MVHGLQWFEGEIGGAGRAECLTTTKGEDLESDQGRTKECWSHRQVSLQRPGAISEATRLRQRERK